MFSVNKTGTTGHGSPAPRRVRPPRPGSAEGAKVDTAVNSMREHGRAVPAGAGRRDDPVPRGAGHAD